MSGKILGLGGVFFKVDDIEAYRGWWSTHMGVDVKDWGSFEWRSDGAGFTMMSPFKADSDYFTPSQAGFMINLRVDDLDEFVAQLKAKNVEILGHVDEGYGKFAWIMDPNDVKIELWQQIMAPD